jgi:hypothetical protein
MALGAPEGRCDPLGPTLLQELPQLVSIVRVRPCTGLEGIVQDHADRVGGEARVSDGSGYILHPQRRTAPSQ